MQLQIYAKGTKLKLTKDWEFVLHEATVVTPVVLSLKKGTILSIHDIDIRGNCAVPKSVKFMIPKKGCPSNTLLESTTFHVHLNQLNTLEFELNSKADLILNDIESIIGSIDKELK